MDNLSSILSRLMSERGIKSTELARKTGVGQPVIHRLMTGITDNPQVFTLKPIADFFGVTLDQLLGFTPILKIINSDLQHDLNSKLITAKTIASAFIDLLPLLIDGYIKASAANLIIESIPEDILPLLSLNATNLFKAINQIRTLLTNNILQE